MKEISIEVPYDVKAITVTILTPDDKNGGLAMITKGIDTEMLNGNAVIKFEIEED